MSNQARFEVFPEMSGGEPWGQRAPTGEYCWHFRDANGRITFTGGESFSRREDAHRAIYKAVADVLRQVGLIDGYRKVPIIDLDQNGDVIEAVA